MTIELWAALAAVLLTAAAAVSSSLALLGMRGPWRRVVVAARAVSLIPLALAITAHGEPSPFDLRQLTLGLGLAMPLIGLGLAWRHGTAGAGPVHDVVVLSLVLAAILAIHPGGSPLNCVQRSFPFWSYWGLFVLGSGSILLAGSTALDLALGAIVPGGERRAPRADSYRLLADAAIAALVAVGGGLVINAWWSWHTTGSPLGGDPRQTWMGATWLVAGMSLLAWQLERRGARIAAVLVVVAAVMALVGLLAVPDLQRLWSV